LALNNKDFDQGYQQGFNEAKQLLRDWLESRMSYRKGQQDERNRIKQLLKQHNIDLDLFDQQ